MSGADLGSRSIYTTMLPSLGELWVVLDPIVVRFLLPLAPSSQIPTYPRTLLPFYHSLSRAVKHPAFVLQFFSCLPLTRTLPSIHTHSHKHKPC